MEEHAKWRRLRIGNRASTTEFDRFRYEKLVAGRARTYELSFEFEDNK